MFIDNVEHKMTLSMLAMVEEEAGDDLLGTVERRGIPVPPLWRCRRWHCGLFRV
jgi:hypothetical protein